MVYYGASGYEGEGKITVRVALFITCFNDTLFPETGRATVEVLERLGVEVDFPLAQTCCGQMHFNTGYQREAIPLVRRFVEVFGDYEAVVAPSGSCVSMVRELYSMAADLAGDPRLAERVEDLGPRVFELSEFLVKRLGVTDVGAYYPHRVTYHPTCHSLRLLRVGDRPLQLLRAVRGLELVELPAAEQCCGFGGTFSIKNSDTSTAMLTDKMANVLSTHAEVCTAGDASCLMHIGGGVSPPRAGARTPQLAAPPRRWPRAPPGPGRRSSACPPHPAGSATCAVTAPSRTPPGTRCATASCGPTSATRRAPSAPSGPAWSARCPTGSSCARPAR